MPRRLGDDPLAKAKAASASGTIRAPANSVFFQRRAPDADADTAPVPVPEPETREISEISEIPEMKEAAAAPTALEPAPSPAAAPASPEPAGQPSFIQEVVTNFAAPVAPVPQTTSVAVASEQAAAPEAPPSVAPAEEAKDGLLHRLFGKLK